MAITKKDLQYEYSWKTTPGDNPDLTGHPDRDLFNRHEGYEVLDMINKIMKHYDVTSIQNAHLIEDMIHNQLPSDLHSRTHVYDWILQKTQKNRI